VIGGRVNASLEAVVQLQIEDSSGNLHTVDAVIDTGFNGDLTLRPAQISALGLPFLGALVGQLADGSLQRIAVHDAILWWDGSPVQVRIQAVESDSLLGTRLLAGHEVMIAFVAGGAVAVMPIP
jgi:clan AA aspartic protease